MQEVLLRDMHMLQHQAGAAVRGGSAPVPGLEQENAVLTQELGKVQERCTRVINEKSTEIEQLHAELVHVRASNIGQATQIRFLQQDIEAAKRRSPRTTKSPSCR